MYHQESWVALDGADGSPCSCSHSYGRQLRINDIIGCTKPCGVYAMVNEVPGDPLF